MMIKQYQIRTKEGLLLHIRHIQDSDAPYLVDLFEHMGPESRYRRFLQPLDNPTPGLVWREAERIAKGDPTTHDGLIAFTDLPRQLDAPIAVVRYVMVEPGIAEVALSVRDDMQGQGIGTQMMQMLAVMARDAGVKKFVGTAQNANKAVWAVLEKLPFPMKRTPEGVNAELEIDLTVYKKEALKTMRA
ncbi:MAG: GNAT family N-acetyltransferase [Anaerolineales bacterium]|nr:GNAT family N-acetyltransferase [Anaerolineales bacterium]